MLTRIKIGGYKTFKNFEVDLTPAEENRSGTVLLSGYSGGGKSNFVDALKLLSQFAVCEKLRYAFQAQRGLPLECFSYGSGGVSELRSKQNVSMSFEVDLRLADFTVNEVREEASSFPTQKGIKDVEETCLRYILKLEMLPDQARLRVVEESLVALETDGSRKKGIPPYLETTDESVNLAIEGKTAPVCYELGRDRTVLSEQLYPPFHPHVMAVKKEFENWRFYNFTSTEPMRQVGSLEPVYSLGRNGEGMISFLHTLKQQKPEVFENIALCLKTVFASKMSAYTPQQISEVDLHVNSHSDIDMFVTINGQKYSSRIVADGILRTLALFLSKYTGKNGYASLVVIENMETGLDTNMASWLRYHLESAYHVGIQHVIECATITQNLKNMVGSKAQSLFL